MEAATRRAAERSNQVAVSSRYKRLPKRLEDDYVVEQKVLGTGYNGSVFRARSKTSDQKFAVKGFHLVGVSNEKMEQLEAEAEIFLSMDHPHVARLVDVYESETQLHLVMECMEGGELFERLMQRKRFNEQDAAAAIHQMLLAVNYIHSRGVVHRDLKLENFLYERMDGDHLKLIDFGFSHIWEPNTKMALSCGTLAYVAPEVLGRSYTSQCDLWSLGVILFILLVGYMPFSGSEKAQRKAIEQGKYSWREDRWKHVSKDAADLTKRLLQKDPSKRLSAEQALKHRWIEELTKKKDQQAGNAVDQAAIDALCDFAKASQFRRACMSVMAWSLTNEERAQVRDMFLALDKSNKGVITLQELKSVLVNHFEVTDAQAKAIFDALDTSQDEEIHYTEFLAAMVSTRIAMHDDLLQQTFQRFDVDNSGHITVANLRQVLGESFSGAEVEQLLKEADLAQSGQVSYPEFIKYLKGEGAENGQYGEVAAKIIDTQLHKNGAKPTIGTMAWAKGNAQSLLLMPVRATGSIVDKVTSGTRQSGARQEQMPTTPEASQAPPTQEDTAVAQSSPEPKKTEKNSSFCALL